MTMLNELADVNFDAVRLDALRVEMAWTKDYARRIHWWVRLFGIVWIVIPVVLTLVAFAFMIGAAGNGTTGS